MCLTRVEVQGNKNPVKEDLKIMDIAFSNLNQKFIPIWWYTYPGEKIKIGAGDLYKQKWRNSFLGKLFSDNAR
jgi:hypothetical protein